ncbi:MAG: hypothetical protein AMXMBFR48_12740 [Ignavibacteriales bacterium]
MDNKLISYAAPVFLSLLMFFSNFMDTEIFRMGENNFAIWFVMSVFCFVAGWFINKTFTWQRGGKMLFGLIVATTVASNILVIWFSEYFTSGGLMSENIILFSLRNVFLGSMGFFGMSVSEVLRMESDLRLTREKLKVYETTIKDVKKESELIIKDAEVKAYKITAEAELIVKSAELKKERIEKELREFIQIEKELIKKYEGNS